MTFHRNAEKSAVDQESRDTAMASSCRRQADRRNGRPLTDDERRWFRQIIQRVPALLVLGPTVLNELYEQTTANAITAEELQIAR